MRYLPHTPEEIDAMLAAVGKSSLDDLFSSVPEDIRAKAPIHIDPALDEVNLIRHVEELAAKNRAATMTSFLGAGAYDHWFPQAADQLVLRSEYYTAYTPYQAEVAQGTLQVIFEFQTIVSEILGLPVANASMYDASTATAEAVLMARRLTKKNHAIISGCVHPQYVETTRTYVKEIDRGTPDMTEVPVASDLGADVDALVAALDAQRERGVAAVVVGYPSFYGPVRDLRPLAAVCGDRGVKLITVTQDPFALAVLASPGEIGADIAVAEGQPLGLPPQYGGPGVGLFATHDDRKSLQQMPGRLCGQTVDADGEPGYVLTLSTREQHIRRDRATSNICTNSGLCATALTIKMCLLGKRGFVEVAEQCLAKAQYLKERIQALDGYEVATDAPVFNEFPVRVRGGDAEAVVARGARGTDRRAGVIAGVPVGRLLDGHPDLLLVAVTEKHRREDLDRLVEALDAV
ncbi:MAG: aminomethyl-transferring glycine dehydrogenase subunit GcvPA [Myxococcota bacterium]